MEQTPEKSSSPEDSETLNVPINGSEPDTFPEADKKSEPKIPIAQVPMDGICGGY